MKVLFVSSGNSKNGINPIVEKQGQSLGSPDYTIDYFTVKGKGVGSYLRASRELKNKLKLTHYDVIHAHYALCGWVAFLARTKEKLVLSFMGDDLIGSNRPNGSVSRKSMLLASANKLLARLFFDAVIVKSRQMWEAFGKSNKLFLIPNGVNTRLFSPGPKQKAKERLGFSEKEKHIVFVSDPGRVEKNFPLAERACKATDEYSVRLHAVHGIRNEELPDYYNAADVLLMTSFHEGSPNVVKEAMSCNCPVVCTDVGDVRFLFGDVAGHYVTTTGVESVKQSLLSAIQFREDRQFTEGRERLQILQLDAPSVAMKLKQIYERIQNN